MVETVKWTGDSLEVLDQTKLPGEVRYVSCRTVGDVAHAIRTMQVRGAPAIGVTAAFGMALAVKRAGKTDDLHEVARRAGELLAGTRPTAVNLFWAIEEMKSHLARVSGGDAADAMERRALEIYNDDIESCRRIGKFGGKLLPDDGAVLTHCNAGALATAGYGTALGVIRGAVESGKKIRVFADETRPFLQGARLTAWELMEDGIPTTLITDNMAAYLMACGEIDAVVVGADRIAANGDTANKIGTYSVALAARAHDIPFFVAAPLSTIDTSLKNGAEIPIEERHPDEVTHCGGKRIAPEGVGVRNPAFDVTPARLITAIITDAGVARPPYEKSIAVLFQRLRQRSE